eukprot:353532-Chlamydomonas_euryale.AAC.3
MGCSGVRAAQQLPARRGCNTACLGRRPWLSNDQHSQDAERLRGGEEQTEREDRRRVFVSALRACMRARVCRRPRAWPCQHGGQGS